MMQRSTHRQKRVVNLRHSGTSSSTHCTTTLVITHTSQLGGKDSSESCFPRHFQKRNVSRDFVESVSVQTSSFND